MKRLVVAAALAGMFCATSVANAQFSANSFVARNSSQQFTRGTLQSSVINRALPQNPLGTGNRGLLSGALGSQQQLQKAKPFSSMQQGPSTSPYMGMISQTPFTSSTTNYFNVVKPQLEAQRANEKLQAQNMRMQQQLTEIAARGPYSTTGSEQRAPTGHAAVYMNNGGVYGNPGGYYPQVPIRSVRGGGGRR